MTSHRLISAFGMFLAAAIGIVVMQYEAVAGAYKGETYTCFFRKAGKVIIDTRDPGTSITYRGKKYPASSGSYFYETTEDVKELTIGVSYSPSTMTKWTLIVDGNEQERAQQCFKKKNLK